MERAIVQPEDVPIPLRALDAVIHDWIIYCEDHYSVFVRGTPHDCSQDTCELFAAAFQFYGCRVCANYHVCRRQVCSSEDLEKAQQHAQSLDDLKRYLGIAYGYWCMVEECEPGLFMCRISGHRVRAIQQHQPSIRGGAMLRENASYQLEQGTVRSAKPFKPGEQHRRPTTLSSSTPVMRPERLFDTNALSYSAHHTLPPPADASDFTPLSADGEEEKKPKKPKSPSDEESESESAHGLSASGETRDVMVNRLLMTALSRTASPEADRRYTTEYFETLEELVNLHVSTFQGPLHRELDTIEPPPKRPASAPPQLAATPALLPPVEAIAQEDEARLRGQLLALARTVITRVHAYWEQHQEIEQEARVRTYDLERTLAHCVPYLLRLMLLLRRYRARLRYIQAANASISGRRSRSRARAPRPVPGVPQLTPQSSAWIDAEEHAAALLLRGFCEPMRLRDATFGEVHELWPADPFIAEAASHGVLDECEPAYVQGPRYLSWVHWALRVLDFTPAALQDKLWETRDALAHTCLF